MRGSIACSQWAVNHIAYNLRTYAVGVLKVGRAVLIFNRLSFFALYERKNDKRLKIMKYHAAAGKYATL